MAPPCPRPITAGRWCRRCWSRASISRWCGRARPMNRCSLWNPCRSGWSRVESDVKEDLSGYARTITQARLVLGWERLWRLAWPVIAWIALFAAIALLDILPRFSSWLHGLILAAFAAGLGWFLFRLRHFRAPSRQEAQRRLEADSGLSHRPLSQLDDKPAPISGDW